MEQVLFFVFKKNEIIKTNALIIIRIIITSMHSIAQTNCLNHSLQIERKQQIG